MFLGKRTHTRLLHSLGRLFNYNLFTTVVEFRVTVLEGLLNLTVLLTDAKSRYDYTLTTVF